MKPAKIITPLVILLILAVVVFRQNGSKPTLQAEMTPQDTIYATLDAAKAGNAKAYLNLFSGQMREGLEQMVREKGQAAFLQYLKATNADLKGLAVFEPKPAADNTVELRVEYVYQDRNEAQIFHLEKTGSGWKIARVLDAERVKTLIPYGTPVQ